MGSGCRERDKSMLMCRQYLLNEKLCSYFIFQLRTFRLLSIKVLKWFAITDLIKENRNLGKATYFVDILGYECPEIERIWPREGPNHPLNPAKMGLKGAKENYPKSKFSYKLCSNTTFLK